MKKKKFSKLAVALCVVVGFSLTFPLMGTCFEKPKYVVITFPGTGTVGYQSGSAMLASLQEITGVKFSAIPAAKTMGRFNLLRNGKAHIAWLPALDQLFAQRGAQEFKKLGPQSSRTLWDCGPIDQGLGTRADSGIKTIRDIQGKRYARYPTYPIVDHYMKAALAYAGLSEDDVKSTSVSSFAAGQRALIEGAVDIAPVSGQSAAAYELEASIHGIHWVEMPNETSEDKAAWARYHKINPAFYPNTVTTAAGTSTKKPARIWGYNYQAGCYDWSDQDLIYWFVKQMAEHYDTWKKGHAYLKKWTVKHCLNGDLWFVPRPEGFIRYFKEVGKWTPKMEKKQKELLAKYPQRMTK